MPDNEDRRAQDARRLRATADDWRKLPTAYETLAAHGWLERTDNGYKSVDLATARRRCRELAEQLESQGTTCLDSSR
jgi:hypothetical protein